MTEPEYSTAIAGGGYYDPITGSYYKTQTGAKQAQAKALADNPNLTPIPPPIPIPTQVSALVSTPTQLSSGPSAQQASQAINIQPVSSEEAAKLLDVYSQYASTQKVVTPVSAPMYTPIPNREDVSEQPGYGSTIPAATFTDSQLQILAQETVNRQKDAINVAKTQLEVANNILADADNYDFTSYVGGKTQYMKDVEKLTTQIVDAEQNLIYLTGLQSSLLNKTAGVADITKITDYYVVTYVTESGKEATKRFSSKAEAEEWAQDYDIHHRKYEVTYQGENGKEVSVSFSDPDMAHRFVEMLTEINVAQAQATSKLLSGSLWEASKNYTETDVEKFLGIIPYSPKGVFEIQAILAGSLENTISPILNLIPGRQPYEVLPGEMNISWKNLEGRGLSPEKLFIGQATGVAAEALGTYLGMMGAGAVVGAGLGLTGGVVTRIPQVGEAAYKAGAFVSKIGSGSGVLAAVGKAALVAPIAVFEGAKLYTMSNSGEPIWKVTAQGAIDLTGMVGFGQGLVKGIQVGQSIPNYLTRLYSGGVTVKAGEVVPEYVLSGEAGFPRFSEETYQPTPMGYKQMALSYTPEELRIAGKVPSFHATDADIVAALGEEGALTGRHGTGMFWSPAASPNFLRINAETSLAPGIPNIFGQPTLLEGGFEDVVATGLGKADPRLAALGKKYMGTGTLLMPIEQLEEAQAIIPAGTKFVSTGGKYWLDFGGGVLIEIKQVLPEMAAAAAGVSGEAVDVTRSAYSLSYRSGTPYLPIIASMAATGFTMSGKPSSVTITPSQVTSLVKIIKSGDLSSSQMSSALSVLTPVSLGSVLRLSTPSVRNDIVSSLASSGSTSSIVTAINSLSSGERSDVISSLSPSTIKNIVSVSSSQETVKEFISNIKNTSSFPDISEIREVTKPPIIEITEIPEPPPQPPPTEGPPPKHPPLSKDLKIKLSAKPREEQPREAESTTFKVVFTHRRRESPKTLEANSFHEALSRTYPSGSTPRVVEVIRLGTSRRRV